jgi:hypothetical protein
MRFPPPAGLRCLLRLGALVAEGGMRGPGRVLGGCSVVMPVSALSDNPQSIGVCPEGVPQGSFQAEDELVQILV